MNSITVQLQIRAVSGLNGVDFYQFYITTTYLVNEGKEECTKNLNKIKLKLRENARETLVIILN